MPVDSMAMVCTPHCRRKSAKAIRSAVQVPKERTCAGRLGGWSAGGGGASLAGTATQWTCEWTSIPAACGWVRRSRLAEAGRRGFFGSFGLRDVMVTSKMGRVYQKEAQAREGVIVKQFLKRGHACARHQ